jgi:membrane-associated protease RseP (regulator of RpoE activity)
MRKVDRNIPPGTAWRLGDAERPPPRDPPAERPIRPRLIELLPPAGLAFAPPPSRPRWGLAAALFALSLLTSTTLGAVWLLMTRTDAITDALPVLGPRTVAAVWSRPEILALGLRFALPALLILLCHELGHYLTARRYGLPSTPPYFLPAPIGIGTFGAFIRIRAPIRDKRQLFDVGVAGPLAGFVALTPFLLYGVAHSRPAAISPAPSLDAAASILLVPGKCLAVELASRLYHDPLPAGTVLDLHPFALAAWFGLLATAINLLPLGQLDGGHILYAVTGRLQRRLALPLWGALAVAGVFYWMGWLLWCLIVLLMGLRHPPVRDETVPVGAGRRALALLALAIFLLAFMPVPLAEVPLR